MSERRFINATFSDFRVVKGRKVLQLFMEVPIEQMLPTLTILGQPGIHDDKWCRIELIEDREEIEFSKPTPKVQDNISASTGEPPSKRKFSDYPLPNQAGMRCKDQQFWQYLRSEGWDCDNEATAKMLVYAACCIKSLSELANDIQGAKAWHTIEDAFQRWITTQKYEGSRRP